MVRRTTLVGALGLGVTLAASAAHATKPCPPPPCAADDAACWEKHASWVAVGRITHVRRRPHGMPLMKDFADFVLQVEAWDKTPGQQRPKQLSMRVGWCNSAKQVPVDTVGTFRFYGGAMASVPDEQGRVAVDYMTFLRVSCPKSDGCNDAPMQVDPKASPRGAQAPRPALHGPPPSAAEGEARPAPDPASSAAGPAPEASSPSARATPATELGGSAESPARGSEAPRPEAPRPEAKGRCGCRIVGAPGHSVLALWGAVLSLGWAGRRRGRAGRRRGGCASVPHSP